MIEHKAVSFKAESVDREERIISGYASTWDKDDGNDIILRGAFAESIAAAGSRVKVLWQHDMSAPIGKPREMREDDRGLYVESYIARTAKGDEAIELAKDGIVDEMSIGYTLGKDDYEYREDDGVRLIRRASLMEYSLVTFAMNRGAKVTSVKSVNPRDLERILRDAGYSRSLAKQVSSTAVRGLCDAGDDAEKKALDDAIRAFRAITA